MGLWSETKRVCLVKQLRAKLDAENDEAKRGKLAAVIAEREKDGSPYWITVKHVGTPEDPMLYEKIKNRYIAALEVVRRRVRLELLDLGADAVPTVFGDNTEGKTLADAIVVMVNADSGSTDAFSALIKDRIVHGLVDGEEEYHRLYALGGPNLIVEAALAVKEFNELEPDMGEG